MKPTAKPVGTGASWPPEEGQIITFKSLSGVKKGILKEVKWGLVWRDFILEDGRVSAKTSALETPINDLDYWRDCLYDCYGKVT